MGDVVDLNTRQKWLEADNQARAANLIANNVLTAEEELALESVTRGQPLSEIALTLNTNDTAHVAEIVANAITKRAHEHAALADKARVIYLERIELLMAAWLPSATNTIAPDRDAANVVLSALAKYADVTGIKSPTRVENNTRITVDIDQRRAAVAASLIEYRKRDLEGDIVE